jgi:hypothetical protein
MKVYFGAALSQKEEYGEYYDRIVGVLEREGHELFRDVLVEDYEEFKKGRISASIQGHKRSLDLLSKCDVAVFEVSFPSTIRIGFEVSTAVEKKKPIVALYKEGKESVYFSGIKNDKMFLSDYRDFDLEEVLREGLQYASSQTETRYNLYLSSKHLNHLDRASDQTRVTKASYIRQLIEHDIKRFNKKHKKVG